MPVISMVRFGDVEADGEYVTLRVTATVGGLLDHTVTVRLTEDKAHRLVASFQAAIAKLNRTRLSR